MSGNEDRIDPTALSVADAAKIFSKAGGRRVPEKKIRVDIESGAPTNADGTVNLIHYAAWLLKELDRAD